MVICMYFVPMVEWIYHSCRKTYENEYYHFKKEVLICTPIIPFPKSNLIKQSLINYFLYLFEGFLGNYFGFLTRLILILLILSCLNAMLHILILGLLPLANKIPCWNIDLFLIIIWIKKSYVWRLYFPDFHFLL